MRAAEDAERRAAEERAARLAAEMALAARRQPAAYVPTMRAYSAPGAFDYSTWDTYRGMMPAAPAAHPMTRRYPVPPPAYPGPTRWAGEDIEGETVVAAAASPAMALTTAPRAIVERAAFPWWLLLVAGGLVVVARRRRR